MNLYIKHSGIRKAENVRNLKITLRYCDRMSFSDSSPFVLDAKREYYVPFTRYSMATDEFPTECCGSEFKRLRWLKTFVLELETTEEKQKELDDIVNQAVTWRFPHNDGYALVLDPARTKRSGWHGAKNRKGFLSASMTATILTKSRASAEPYDEPVPNDPQEAKDRLVKDGVDFIVWDGEPDILNKHCLTFYVVSLTYEARRV